MFIQSSTIVLVIGFLGFTSSIPTQVIDDGGYSGDDHHSHPSSYPSGSPSSLGSTSAPSSYPSGSPPSSGSISDPSSYPGSSHSDDDQPGYPSDPSSYPSSSPPSSGKISDPSSYPSGTHQSSYPTGSPSDDHQPGYPSDQSPYPSDSQHPGYPSDQSSYPSGSPPSSGTISDPSSHPSASHQPGHPSDQSSYPTGSPSDDDQPGYPFDQSSYPSGSPHPSGVVSDPKSNQHPHDNGYDQSGGIIGSNGGSVHQAQEYVQAWKSVTTKFESTLKIVSESGDYQSSYRLITELQTKVQQVIKDYQTCSDCQTNGSQYKDQQVHSVSTCIHDFQKILQICKTRYAPTHDQFFAHLLIEFQSFFTFAKQSCSYFGIDPHSLLVGLDLNFFSQSGINLNLLLGSGSGLLGGKSGLLGGLSGKGSLLGGLGL